MTWPWLKEYTGTSLRRISLPLGGIGTGTIGWSGRGHLRDWELLDHPAHGEHPDVSLFALRVATADGTVLATRALEGPLDESEYEGASGSRVHNHGLPRFERARFRAAYPLGQLDLAEEGFPVDVRVQAFNPFVPSQVAESSLPVAVIRFVLTNPGAEPLSVAVVGAASSPLGEGESAAVKSHDGLTGVELAADQGSFALTLVSPGPAATTRTGWVSRSWGNGLLSFWEDFASDGALSEEPGTPMAAVADRRTLGPGQSTTFTFVLGWHVPVRRAWKWIPEAWGDSWDYDPDTLLLNHYALGRSSAWEAVEQVVPRLGELEERTVGFVREFLAQDVPEPLLEAALFTASTLRSQTCFRTGDGHFFGWEGCGDRVGSCHGNCTHVWHYEYATSHLFGELARDMRELEFAHATDERGLMSFRIGLPLETKAREWPLAAADGQMGAIVRLYHDWRLSGDDGFLRELWPAARRALEFAWIEGGWDADRDGVMEGVQHNTYDVEFYGPNPQTALWYLAALDAAARIAGHLGDHTFAQTCRSLLASGRERADVELFNGEYYVQRIRPWTGPTPIAAGLKHPTMGAKDPADPPFQLGDGCLIDQLVGQVAAHLAGLGHQLAPERVGSAALAVLKHNWRDRFDRDLNHMRSFALGAEPGLVISSYPRGNRPARPFPYFTEAMTGFEYTAATSLIQEGHEEEALKVVTAVRARYEGAKRNPFAELEAGRHYARSMASWGTLLAWQGFEYDRVSAQLKIQARGDSTRYVWATGGAWGTVRSDSTGVRLAVREGELSLRTLVVAGHGTWDLGGTQVLTAGSHRRIA